MAKADVITLCPICEAPTDLSLANCGSCGRRQVVNKNAMFETPDYLMYQRSTLLENLDKDLGLEELSKRTGAIEDNFISWARECPDEDKHAALHDAYTIMRHLMHSKTQSGHIINLIQLGRSIGKLADSVDAYFKANGAINEREARPVLSEPGNDLWSATATAKGGDNT